MGGLESADKSTISYHIYVLYCVLGSWQQHPLWLQRADKVGLLPTITCRKRAGRARRWHSYSSDLEPCTVRPAVSLPQFSM